MSGPFVSVVIPVRDRAELLVRLLEALEGQTYRAERFEAIVVDNRSTDGSGDAARSFAESSSMTVRVIDHPDGGAVAARNRGAADAAGDVLAFTDSDCRPAAGWIEAGVRAMAHADLAHGETRADPDLPRGPLDRTVEGGFATGLYDTCNLFIRAEAFRALGGFDAGFARRIRLPRTRAQLEYGFGEDTDLAWRAVRSGCRAVAAPGALVHHHVFPPSVRDAVRRTWLLGAFPSLVRAVPELRGTLLRSSVFIGDERPWFYLAVIAIIASRRRRALAAAVAPYLLQRFRSAHGTRAQRVRDLPALAGLDALATVALAVGSAASRTPVL
ncbi:MAG: glycosyltransferase family 2 protein [Actinomycetota bacterium]